MSDQKRPEWMTSISANVDLKEYLQGRAIDKTFELSQKEKADRAKEVRINLLASDKLRLTGDPILDLERRKQALKYEIMTNPVKRKQMRNFLLKREHSYKESEDLTETKDYDDAQAKRYIGHSSRDEYQRAETHSSRSSRTDRDHRDDHGHRHRTRDKNLAHKQSSGDRSHRDDRESRRRHSNQHERRHERTSDGSSHKHRRRSKSPRKHSHDRMHSRHK